MLKKNSEGKWTNEVKESFKRIKKTIGEASVLSISDYLNEFLIFSFASEHTIVAMLLQKNDEGFKQPIGFFSKILRDIELRYDMLEK